MKKLLILLILLCGCASPKQIATCVQTCEGINAIVHDYIRNDKGLYCTCSRIYLIDDSGTQIKEVTK